MIWRGSDARRRTALGWQGRTPASAAAGPRQPAAAGAGRAGTHALQLPRWGSARCSCGWGRTCSLPRCWAGCCWGCCAHSVVQSSGASAMQPWVAALAGRKEWRPGRQVRLAAKHGSVHAWTPLGPLLAAVGCQSEQHGDCLGCSGCTALLLQQTMAWPCTLPTVAARRLRASSRRPGARCSCCLRLACWPTRCCWTRGCLEACPAVTPRCSPCGAPAFD